MVRAASVCARASGALVTCDATRCKGSDAGLADQVWPCQCQGLDQHACYCLPSRTSLPKEGLLNAILGCGTVIAFSSYACCYDLEPSSCLHYAQGFGAGLAHIVDTGGKCSSNEPGGPR